MDIMVDELQERIEAGENVPRIDVREPYEHEEYNIGGQLIPLGSLPVRLNEIPQDKEAEIVMYCRSGGRSGMAKQFLEQNGYSNVRNLVGGMLEWQRRFEKN
jgi:rhodanese-related sulfurtransferase